MNMLSRIFGKQTSANIAKERLSIIVAHERSVKIPYMDEMRKEILEVVKKYTNTDKISIKADSNQDINMLEIEIILGSKA